MDSIAEHYEEYLWLFKLIGDIIPVIGSSFIPQCLSEILNYNHDHDDCKQ